MKQRAGFFSLVAFVIVIYFLAACKALPNGAPSNPFQLANTKWTLTSMTQNGALQPLSAPIPTLEFQANTLGGNSGCNTYGGDYKTQGELIQIESLRMTLMACTDASVMAQESAYVKALQSARLYEMQGGSLKIAYGDGNGQLVFQRVSK